MKKDASFFDGVEPDLIFVARRLKDATRLESILDEAGIEYGVEPDHYQAGIVFRTTRVGAFFYVLPAERDRAVDVLLRNGYVPVPPGDSVGSPR